MSVLKLGFATNPFISQRVKQWCDSKYLTTDYSNKRERKKTHWYVEFGIFMGHIFLLWLMWRFKFTVSCHCIWDWEEILTIDGVGRNCLQHNIELNSGNFISHFHISSVWSVDTEWDSVAYSHPRFLGVRGSALFTALLPRSGSVLTTCCKAKDRKKTWRIMAPWGYQAWKWEQYFPSGFLWLEFNHKTT